MTRNQSFIILVLLISSIFIAVLVVATDITTVQMAKVEAVR